MRLAPLAVLHQCGPSLGTHRHLGRVLLCINSFRIFCILSISFRLRPTTLHSTVIDNLIRSRKTCHIVIFQKRTCSAGLNSHVLHEDGSVHHLIHLMHCTVNHHWQISWMGMDLTDRASGGPFTSPSIPLISCIRLRSTTTPRRCWTLQMATTLRAAVPMIFEDRKGSYRGATQVWGHIESVIASTGMLVGAIGGCGSSPSRRGRCERSGRYERAKTEISG